MLSLVLFVSFSATTVQRLLFAFVVVVAVVSRYFFIFVVLFYLFFTFAMLFIDCICALLVGIYFYLYISCCRFALAFTLST